jgi:glutathione synthase
VSDAPPHAAFEAPLDVRLADVECVFIRKDPPFDSEYLYITLMLEKLRGRTLVVNDPRGLRDANEKLYTLHFARHMPRTLVTSDRDRIHRFFADVGVGVVKPLDGAGGSGVMVVEKGDRNARSIVDYITHEGTRHAMAQEYVPAVRQGDKRVLLLDGEVLGAINRIPREDDVRSNIHAGGRVEPCKVTAEEKAVVADMIPRLAADGLVFVGLDFIGGRLTEVNVTSPTGIQELSRHEGRDVAERVIAWIERHAVDSRPPLGSVAPPS